MSGDVGPAKPERSHDRVDVAAGEVLCARGERLNALFLVRSGEVELVGHQHREVLGPGQIFGELGIDRSAAASCSSWTVRGLSEASLLRIDGAGLQRRFEDRTGSMPLMRLRGLTA